MLIRGNPHRVIPWPAIVRRHDLAPKCSGSKQSASRSHLETELKNIKNDRGTSKPAVRYTAHYLMGALPDGVAVDAQTFINEVVPRAMAMIEADRTEYLKDRHAFKKLKYRKTAAGKVERFFRVMPLVGWMLRRLDQIFPTDESHIKTESLAIYFKIKEMQGTPSEREAFLWQQLDPILDRIAERIEKTFCTMNSAFVRDAKAALGARRAARHP